MRNKYLAILLLWTIACLVQPAEAQLIIVDTEPGEFIDISDSGERLNLPDDGTVNRPSSVGNAVLPAGMIEIGNNGGVGFGTMGAGLDPNNATIPSNLAFMGEQALLPYWDDIDDDKNKKGGDVFFEIQENGVAIIQWNDLPLKDMKPAMGGASATIGYQDGEAGFIDVTWSLNMANSVKDGTVLSLMDAKSPTIYAQFHYRRIATNRVTFQIQYVPEPSTALLVLVGIPFMLRKRARKMVSC